MAKKPLKNLPAPEPVVETTPPDETTPVAPSVSAPVVPEYIFNGNKEPKAMNVLHVRCISPAQIGALGSSLDAKRGGLEMELRPDLGGVLVSLNLGGKEREYLIPMANIAHIELEVVCVNVR